jgi:pimeloyl-ACP methyl ester carboxylesterase
MGAGMQAIQLPEIRAFLRYVDIPGREPPLVWLHGWQCSSTGELLPVAVEPALRGRRSLLVDFLGHGYSDKPADFAYSLEAHAGTIVALLDALRITECGIVGHSMGGGVAVLVAAARPAAVTLLVMAEGSLDRRGDPASDGQSESDFVASGFAALIAEQAAEAEAAPDGIRARHVEMTRLIDPRAMYREDASLNAGTQPPVREILAGVTMPRWYLIGEWSDPGDDERELERIGVGWRVVPDTGHPMGLQNPAGFAQVVANVVAAAWPG